MDVSVCTGFLKSHKTEQNMYNTRMCTIHVCVQYTYVYNTRMCTIHVCVVDYLFYKQDYFTSKIM